MKWYRCRVVNPSALGKGYTATGPAWATKHADGERVIITNGADALRLMEREEARKCLKILRKCDPDENAVVDDRYRWELNK